MKTDRHTVWGVAATAFLIMVSFILWRVSTSAETPGGKQLRCVIEPGTGSAAARGLVTGYNYHLLENFAEDNGYQVMILHSMEEGNYMDSLKLGRVDIVAVPFRHDLSIDGVLVSSPVDSMGLWLTRRENRRLMRKINAWLDDYHESDVFHPTRKKFLNTYDPIKRASSGRKNDHISPYDSLVKVYSDSLGWDWRLVSAVIYQESHFRIDGFSRKGARGLMQMMPQTAQRMDAGNLFNPEESIKAGTSYLALLSKKFSKVAADRNENVKFTLAAYNAGEGRIEDCINYAAFCGKNTGYWDEVASVIPQMRDASILQVDTVKLGIFNGNETLSYVDNVLAVYAAFRRICP